MNKEDIPNQIIHELKNAIVTSDGVVLKNFSYFIPSLIDLNYFPYSKLKYISLVYFRKKKIKTGKLQKYLLVHDFWYPGYFHWLADTLPRIWSVKDKTREFILLLPSGIKQYHLDALKPFKFKGIQYVKAWQKCKVSHLTMPGHITPSGYFSPAIMIQIAEFYRKQYSVSKIQFKKIYISRKKASYRKIVNEPELINLLEHKGYKIICAEDHSFEDQVKLFWSCENLVSVHGAGLTNMLFMPRGSSVIELRMEVVSPNNTFGRLASALGHNFLALNCLPEGGKDFQKGNIIVDFKKIEKLYNE